jgi:hypothetical protein
MNNVALYTSRPIVTSASEHEDDGDEHEEASTSSSRNGGAAGAAASSDSEDDAWSAGDGKRGVHFPDDLLDEGADDEDEAYVYRHLRSGMLEPVTVVSQRSGSEGPAGAASCHPAGKQTTTVQMLKPRSSDAVLSCPCCFTTVSMDCQRHERYLNQFRAMFVMNVEVAWHETWVYSEVQQGPVRHHFDETTLVRHPNGSVSVRKDLPAHYYTVNCSSCHTQVAVLDMVDEVYHFTGCLASS